jgi:hypothetical protein
MIAAFAESIELAAVDAYARCLPLVVAGSRSDSVAALARFEEHHRAHASEFGALARGSGSHQPNAKLAAALEPRLAAVVDDATARQFLLDLENQLATTYAFELSEVDDTDVARALATILPVEAEHAAYVGTTLGRLGPSLFPNGSFERVDVGDAADTRLGFDANLYPSG